MAERDLIYSQFAKNSFKFRGRKIMSKSAGFTLSVFAQCLEPDSFHFGGIARNATEVCTDEFYVDSICDLEGGSKIQCLCSFNTDSPFMVPKCDWEDYFPMTTTAVETTTTKIITTELLTTEPPTTELPTTELTTEPTTEFTTENITSSIFDDYCTSSPKTFNFQLGKLKCLPDGYCQMNCDPGTIPSRLVNSEQGRCSKFTQPKKINCSVIIDHREMKCIPVSDFCTIDNHILDIMSLWNSTVNFSIKELGCKLKHNVIGGKHYFVSCKQKNQILNFENKYVLYKKNQNRRSDKLSCIAVWEN